MFELTSNWFQKFISGKWDVWLLLQIRSNWRAFPVDRISEPKRRKWISVSIFTSNDFWPWKIEERERERERGRNKEEITIAPAPRRLREVPISVDRCVDRAKFRSVSRSRERSPITILPSFVRIWLFFSEFCLCSEEWMILCIRLVTKKMWATSRKCVFYGIFKNTTKHQKIFSKTFFEMQPNTWKHFPFRKIAFPENIYFPEILLHEPNAA